MNITGGRSSIRYGSKCLPLLQGRPGTSTIVTRIWHPSSISSMRTVFLLPRKKHPNSKKSMVKKREPIRPQVDKKLARESMELEKKIKDMQAFTAKLKAQLKKDKEKEAEQHFQDISKPIEQDSGDVDVIYNELLGDFNDQPLLLGESDVIDGRVSLFDQPAKGLVIPKPMLDKIGDKVVNIINKDNPNWDAVIIDLAQNKDGFSGVSKKSIHQFLGQIAIGKTSSKSLEIIHEMLKTQNIAFNVPIYDFFMRHYAELGSKLLVESFYQQALHDGVKPTQYMFSHLIKVYSKHKDLMKINQTLQMMQHQQIEPGLVIYTNVLQLCVNLKDSKQAHDVFQMMKFRSKQTKPDIEAYNAMILMATKENDIYKALDLYRELLDAKLKPNLFTLNCLARCCSKNKDFFIQGWKFINEINERRLTPNIKTFESMLRLAAKDGDLELARALYITIYKMRQDLNDTTAGSEALVYLMMAYRDYKIGNRPSMLSFEEGLTIRRNALNLVDFLGLHQDVDYDLDESREKNQSPPFLPSKNLIHSKQVTAESNAIWSFHLLNDPEHTLTLPNLITFLRIPIEHQEKEEFLRRFEEFTYSSPEIQYTEIQQDPESEAQQGEEKKVKVEIEIDQEKDNDKSLATIEDDLPAAIKISQALRLKMERNSELYITYLSAGKRFNDVDICEKAWIERGRYRKTSSFRKLPKQDRDQQDYRFAKEMILAFTQLGLLGDAVKIVKSTQNQFDWKFYTLKPLYSALLSIGDDHSMKVISAICNARKGQVLPEMLKAQEKPR